MLPFEMGRKLLNLSDKMNMVCVAGPWEMFSACNLNPNNIGIWLCSSGKPVAKPFAKMIAVDLRSFKLNQMKPRTPRMRRQAPWLQ